jgi:hypothetical protein
VRELQSGMRRSGRKEDGEKGEYRLHAGAHRAEQYRVGCPSLSGPGRDARGQLRIIRAP